MYIPWGTKKKYRLMYDANTKTGQCNKLRNASSDKAQ